MIRPATLADIDWMISLALREVKRYPRLRPDAQKMRKSLIQIVSAAKHFCWVSEDDDKCVTGALVAITNENLWAQRQSSNILMWVADVRGDGIKLLREFRDWIRSRRAVKVAGFAPDNDDIDPRVWKLAEMMGFKRCGGAYLLYN